MRESFGRSESTPISEKLPAFHRMFSGVRHRKFLHRNKVGSIVALFISGLKAGLELE